MTKYSEAAKAHVRQFFGTLHSHERETCTIARAFDAGVASVPAPVPAPVLLTADDPRYRDGAKVRGEYADGTVAECIIANGVAWMDRRLYGFGFDDFAAVYLLAEAPDPDADRVETLASALHDCGWCEEAWPTCSISTLENYRDSARSLLARLDSKRADA